MQYSALEVQQTIEATLETNFMLEIEDELLSDELDKLTDNENNALEAAENESTLDFDGESLKEIDINNDISHHDEAYNSEYSSDEFYSDRQVGATNQSNHQEADDYTSAENYTAEQKSLHDHLNWQADTFVWSSEFDEIIASYLIDEINDEGYLQADLAEILSAINHNESLKIDLSNLEAVLSCIQQFEPSGVAARNVQECLLLQLRNLPNSPYKMTAIQLINEHFDWLSYHDHKRIKKMYGLDDQELDRLLKLIQSLNPRPGREFSATQPDIIIPDIRLSRSRQGWLVELNTDAFPVYRLIRPILTWLTNWMIQNRQEK